MGLFKLLAQSGLAKLVIPAPVMEYFSQLNPLNMIKNCTKKQDE